MRTMQSSFYFNAGFNNKIKKSEIQNNGITHRLYRDKCQFVLDSVASEILRPWKLHGLVQPCCVRLRVALPCRTSISGKKNLPNVYMLPISSNFSTHAAQIVLNREILVQQMQTS